MMSLTVVGYRSMKKSNNSKQRLTVFQPVIHMLSVVIVVCLILFVLYEKGFLDVKTFWVNMPEHLTHS